MGALEDLTIELRRIADVLERAFPPDEPPPMPGTLGITFTGEFQVTIGDEIMDLIKFKVAVPAEATGDVLKRTGSVTFANGTVTPFEVSGKDAAESEEFSGDQDSTVIVSLVNVDDAGNESPARVQSFVLVDTIAPPEPGEIGLFVTGEVTP